MFRCDGCGQSSLPKESPNFITVKSEVMEYSNRNLETKETKVSVGTQIVQEAKLCRECAGKGPVEAGDNSAYVVNLRGSRASVEHSRRCKKNLGECKVCEQIMKFHNEMPLHHLSLCLAEGTRVQ